MFHTVSARYNVSVSETLLQSKLIIPPLRPHLVPRRRLIEALNLGLEPGCKLTLVSAPAGFGKTTLLIEWVNQCDPLVAWLSLEEGDNDPDRFLAYLVAAVQQVLPGKGYGEATLAMRRSAQAVPMELALTALLNEIAEETRPFALLLDDYHVVDEDSIHDCLSYFLHHLPDHIHLFIATRVDPPLGLARLRARSELREVRLDDLRFTPDEVRSFLESSAGIPLSNRQVEVLETRTEGWPAGLQLAALSLRDSDDPERFITRLGGADRYIFDYLAEEVLSSQSQADQSFLMATSILDRLNGSVCDAVTGERNGQLTLERLEASNLFILPLDSKRNWYRYHQLFSGFLRDRLAVLHADELHTLHQRAGEWFASNGMSQDAVSHYLAAGDHLSAVALIEEESRQLLARGESRTLTRWMEVIPPDIIRARPKLCLALTWSKVTGGGGWENVDSLIQDAAQGLGIDADDVVAVLDDGVDDVAQRRTLCDLAVIQGFLVREGGDLPRAVEQFEAVLKHRPREDPLLGAFAAGGLGSLYMRAGEARRAEQAFREAVTSVRHTGGPFGLVLILSMVGAAQAWQGQLHLALQTLRQAMEAATDSRGRPLPFAGQAAVGMAHVLLEQNELESALDAVRQGLNLSRQVKDLDGLLDGYITLARILLAEGDLKSASKAMDEAEKTAIEMGAVSCTERAVLWRVNLELIAGNVEAASRSAKIGKLKKLANGDSVNAHGETPSLVYGRLLLAQGRAGDALALIEPQLSLAEQDGRTHNLLELLVLQAACLSALNRSQEAITVLARALLLAEPEGYVRPFVDAGSRIAPLLQTAGAQGHSSEYVKSLLPLFGQTIGPATVDPLSERELEVLRLMADGLSNPQIAKALTIAVSTVKTHVNRIYSKLDVRSRTQAVARARKARLID